MPKVIKYRKIVKFAEEVILNKHVIKYYLMLIQLACKMSSWPVKYALWKAKLIVRSKRYNYLAWEM